MVKAGWAVAAAAVVRKRQTLQRRCFQVQGSCFSAGEGWSKRGGRLQRRCHSGLETGCGAAADRCKAAALCTHICRPRALGGAQPPAGRGSCDSGKHVHVRVEGARQHEHVGGRCATRRCCEHMRPRAWCAAARRGACSPSAPAAHHHWQREDLAVGHGREGAATSQARGAATALGPRVARASAVRCSPRCAHAPALAAAPAWQRGAPASQQSAPGGRLWVEGAAGRQGAGAGRLNDKFAAQQGSQR